MSDLRPDTDSRLRLLVFCLLLGAYLLVYVPQPNSADGDAVLAVAANLTRHGSPDINSIAQADWLLPLPASRMGAFGADGTLYAKKSPTPSLLLLPFVALSDALPWTSTRATAMLFNPLVTALTGALLYSLLRRLDYRPRAALTVALVYGLATFAVVYVKTLFGEALAALLILLAVYALHRYRAGRHARDLLVAGSALGLLLGVNLVYAVIGAVVGIFMLIAFGSAGASSMSRDRFKDVLQAGLILSAPIVVAVVLLGAYNLWRFGDLFSSGYHFAEGEGFTRPLLTGLYGLFVSPFRGVFWYNPVLIAALPGWVLLRRRDSYTASLTAALVLAQALMFAGWWSWHGGIVWGPRFLLPTLPLIAVWLAPLVAWVLRSLDAGSRRRLERIALTLLAVLLLLSVGVQMLGVLYSHYPYINGYLNVHYWTGEFDAPLTALRDEVLYTPGLSPIVGHLALVAAGWQLEPAWLAHGVDGVHLLLALAVMGVGGAIVITRIRLRWGAAIACAVIFMAANGMIARQQRHPDSARAHELAATLDPPGTLVAATGWYGSALLDLPRDWRVTALHAPTDPADPWATALLSQARSNGGTLWYVNWFAPGQAEDWTGRDLFETTAFVEERTLTGHRALRFDLDAGTNPTHTSGAQFGDILLQQYGVSVATAGVSVTLVWSTDAPLSADYQWFVHVLDADGAIIAQQDRPPQGSFAPTSTWSSGESVTDRLFFPLATPESAAQVRVGWLDPASGTRLPTANGDGFVVLSATDR